MWEAAAPASTGQCPDIEHNQANQAEQRRAKHDGQHGSNNQPSDEVGLPKQQQGGTYATKGQDAGDDANGDPGSQWKARVSSTLR
jgi:hypothetical protein